MKIEDELRIARSTETLTLTPPEYIESGSTILSGLDPQKMTDSMNLITSHSPNWEWNLSLGDGRTASKVVNILMGQRRKILDP